MAHLKNMLYNVRFSVVQLTSNDEKGKKADNISDTRSRFQ